MGEQANQIETRAEVAAAVSSKLFAPCLLHEAVPEVAEASVRSSSAQNRQVLIY